MAKNLINGDNIIIEEDNDNIKMNLSDSYTSSLTQSIANSYKSNNIFSTRSWSTTTGGYAILEYTKITD